VVVVVVDPDDPDGEAGTESEVEADVEVEDAPGPADFADVTAATPRQLARANRIRLAALSTSCARRSRAAASRFAMRSVYCRGVVPGGTDLQMCSCAARGGGCERAGARCLSLHG
jgi:hypothetical protein